MRCEAKVKDTPILQGKDAERFSQKMKKAEKIQSQKLNMNGC